MLSKSIIQIDHKPSCFIVPHSLMIGIAISFGLVCRSQATEIALKTLFQATPIANRG